MKRLLLAPLLLAGVAPAAAPTFDTPAPIAYMADLSSGAVLFAKDENHRIPPASLAKMMTVYVAFDLIKKGQLSLDKMMTVSPETWKQWHGPAAGSTMFLSPGEQVSVRNLLFGIITLSGNDACVVLAQGIAGTEPSFTQLMNRKAQELGLANSHFGTSNGWPDNGVTYVTAKDLTTLATRTIQDFPDLYKIFYSRPSFTWGKTLGSGTDITQANRDPLLGHVQGADGLKTGHTDEAGYSFTGSAEQGGRRLVMVIAGLDTFNHRAEQSIAFMNWGFNSWQARPLAKQGQVVQHAEVQGGAAREVALVAPRDFSITLPAGLLATAKTKVVYKGPVPAPIKAGDHIADLVVTSPDLPGPETMPLTAQSAVAKAGFLGRVAAGFRWLIGMA